MRKELVHVVVVTLQKDCHPLRCVVWSGVVRYGMVGCGMVVRYGMVVECDMVVGCDIVWCILVRWRNKSVVWRLSAVSSKN